MADFDEILNKTQDYAINALGNAAWSGTLGLLGLEPPESLKEWQEENPKAALASGFTGTIATLTPMGKALQASAYGAKVATAIKASEKLAKAPVAAKALEFMALDAPIELGRQALGFGVQKAFDLEGQDVFDRALESGLSLGLSAGVGAIGGAIISSGKHAMTNLKLKEIDVKDPWQWQLRKINSMVAEESDPIVKRDLENAALKLNKAIRGETRDRLIGRLENETESFKGFTMNDVLKGNWGFKSRLLQTTSDATDTTRFRSGKELLDVLETMEEDFGADWVAHTQFPRWVQGDKKALKKVSRGMDKTGKFAGLEYTGDGWFIGKEQDGMYVIAKSMKTRGGKNGMMVFKTDTPEKFLPQKFETKAKIDRNMFVDPNSVYKDIEAIPNSLYNQSLRVGRFLAENGQEASLSPAAGSIWDATDKGFSKLMQKITGDAGFLKDSEIWNRTKTFAKRYVYPTVFKFKNSPEARRIVAQAKYTMDTARLKAAEKIFGAPRVDLEGSTIGWLTKGIARNDPEAWATKAKAFAKANPEGEKVFVDILNARVPTDALTEAQRQLLGKEGLDLLHALDVMDSEIFNEMTASIDALHLGEKAKYIMRQGHRGISHYFEGSLRQAVLDEHGNVVHISAGNSKGVVMEQAKDIIERAKELGREWSLGDYWSHDRALDMKHLKMLNPEDAQVSEMLAEKYTQGKVLDASFQKSSADISGFKAVRSMNDIIESLHTSVENKYVWLGNEIIDNVLAKDIQALGLVDPQTAVMVQDTLKAVQGQSGEFSAFVNRTFDSVLSPLLGSNSASKIAQTLNASMARLDLGFWNMSYFLANLLQPLQTVTPQLSMLMRCPEALQWAYDTVPICGAKRGGLVSVFSPFKWLSKGMRLMANPKVEDGLEEFLAQMVKEGTLTSRALESYVGESSEYGLNLVKAFREGKFASGLKNIANWTANYSEQVSRAYALTVGYAYGNSLSKARLAQGLEGWSKDQLYTFARKFCDNTMFQFATADRAKILQGPVGTTWGLFKNWAMHWVGWEMQYLDAGLKYGQWTPFMLSNTMTALLGGIGASEVGKLGERFYEWASDEKMARALYDRWDNSPESNLVLYGIPGAFGFSLRNQVTSAFADPGDEASRMLSVASFSRLKALWNALGSGMDYYVSTGDINFAKDRNFQQQLLRAVAPKNLYRQLQVVDGQIRTMGTKNLVMNAGPAASFFYKWFNLPSVDIDQAFKISGEIWKDKNARIEATAAASNVLADALETADSRVIAQVLAQVGAQGLELDSVINAASTKLSNRSTPLLLREHDALMDWLGVLEP